mgnify:CR=1 FL=1
MARSKRPPLLFRRGDDRLDVSCDVVVHVDPHEHEPHAIVNAANTSLLGGAVPDADLDRLNLAAKVADGERVLVQKVGDPTAPADPSGATSAVPGTGSATGPVNLNTASYHLLSHVSGIGPGLAKAIVERRSDVTEAE